MHEYAEARRTYTVMRFARHRVESVGLRGRPDRIVPAPGRHPQARSFERRHACARGVRLREQSLCNGDRAEDRDTQPGNPDAGRQLRNSRCRG